MELLIIGIFLFDDYLLKIENNLIILEINFCLFLCSRGIGSDARGGISGRLNGTLTGGGAGMEPMWGGPPPHHMQHHVQPPSVGPPPSVIATPGAKLGQGQVPGSYLINFYSLI